MASLALWGYVVCLHLALLEVFPALRAYTVLAQATHIAPFIYTLF